MSFIVSLIIMVLLHIINDFNLQGIIAEMKQESWWADDAEKYKFDYRVALLEHSFSWTCFIMLPWIVCRQVSLVWFMLFILNVGVHCYVDDLKANKFRINLVGDQIIHFVQIMVTLIILGSFY